jgi:Ca2+-binding EF-hand superfamily protein
VKKRDVLKIIDLVDLDKNGTIEYNEFEEMMARNMVTPPMRVNNR